MKKYLLYKSLSLFFLPLKNLFFLHYGFGFSMFYLPSFFFYSLNFNKYSFFFFSKFFWKSFLSHLKSIYIGFFFFFFSKFKLRGLGFRAKHITKNFVRFFIGTTNFYYFHVPLFFFMRVKRRKIFFFSFNKSILKIIFLKLGFLKKLIPYKLRGFFFPRQFVLMKPGKKRF